MTTRTVEVFSADCSVCNDAIEMIQGMACSSCDVQILDMNDPEVAERADELGITAVPAVVIDGELVECCEDSGPDKATLRNTGLGQVA
jgi:glutaredoxin 3